MLISSNPILEDWNQLGQEAAAEAILPCNGSVVWASRMASNRPSYSAEQLTRTSNEIWRSLSHEEWQQAFDSHPRIGEKCAKSASAASERWSMTEQSSAQADVKVAAALAEGNREYEARFGRIFIVCATGKSAAEILADLLNRMSNDPDTELQEAAEQQRLITQLRLRKWLQSEAR